jgi:hypothetical protein
MYVCMHVYARMCETHCFYVNSTKGKQAVKAATVATATATAGNDALRKIRNAVKVRDKDVCCACM